MITLRPTDLHWIKGDHDDPADLCAHSPVEFRVGPDVFVRPDDGAWTVSASALYLLRTLERPHLREAPVGDQLFPCCGHSLIDAPTDDEVLILGCPSGVDVWVLRHGDDVWLRGPGGREQRVRSRDWTAAVCRFSDAVDAFYAASSAKRPGDDEQARGFRKFLHEWQMRRSRA